MPTAIHPFEGWEDEPTVPFAQIPAPRVLLAEDDRDLRALVAARLRRNGCTVLEASNGDEALGTMVAIAEHQSIDEDLSLAILDVRMPHMSGIEVVYMLRRWRWNTPVLLITAYPEPELIDEAARLGVSVLAKPFGIEHLGTAAAAVMRGMPISPWSAQ